jgi:hypothetical protein
VKKGIGDPYAWGSKLHTSFTYQQAPFYGAVVGEQASLLRLIFHCVDVKSAPHAKHTASRISWLHTRGTGVGSGSVPVNFP